MVLLLGLVPWQLSLGVRGVARIVARRARRRLARLALPRGLRSRMRPPQFALLASLTGSAMKGDFLVAPFS